MFLLVGKLFEWRSIVPTKVIYSPDQCFMSWPVWGRIWRKASSVVGRAYSRRRRRRSRVVPGDDDDVALRRVAISGCGGRGRRSCANDDSLHTHTPQAVVAWGRCCWLWWCNSKIGRAAAAVDDVVRLYAVYLGQHKYTHTHTSRANCNDITIENGPAQLLLLLLLLISHQASPPTCAFKGEGGG